MGNIQGGIAVKKIIQQLTICKQIIEQLVSQPPQYFNNIYGMQLRKQVLIPIKAEILKKKKYHRSKKYF